MMITICWAAKGGSGTTVVAASLALVTAAPVLIVDLDGDMPEVLGVPVPDGPGVLDWLRSDAPAARLGGLESRVTDLVSVLPRGEPSSSPSQRWPELASWLTRSGRQIVVDAGSGVTPPADLMGIADQRLLVTRACYLALKAAVRQQARPTGVIVIEELGRALRPGDVAASIGAPVIARVLVDPAVARAVDAGLLAAHLPHGFRRALRCAA